MARPARGESLGARVCRDDVPDAAQPEMSNWTVSLEEEGEIRVGGNTYLHDNVD